MKSLLLIVLIFSSLSVFTNERKMLDAALELAITIPTLGKRTGEEVIPEDTIGGRCTYKGSHCNGAKVQLLNGKKVLKENILTAGTFYFPNLKQNPYKIKVVFEKFKIEKQISVLKGQFIRMELKDE